MEIGESRLCNQCLLVTAKDDCPLCDVPTLVHPSRDMEDGYCLDCGAEFRASDLVVISWEDDPYFQDDDGMMTTICRSCQQEREADE